MIRPAIVLPALLLALACSGGGGGGGDEGNLGGSGIPGVEASVVCTGTCPQQALSVGQVQLIVSQAVAQVQAMGSPPATVAVVDRVGNVLAVFQMNGAAAFTTITSQRGVNTGLQGIAVPSTLAAISKAGTAAYLSTQGHGFTSRTASQIVQQNFNPGATNQPGGPLFGVQFSQLPCGDLVKAFGVNALEGPKGLPLGFAADPGGLPLYIQGVPVGGVGVEFDGLYTLDPNTGDTDVSPEEQAAVAASNGFQTPEDRRADRITVLGLALRFADDEGTIATATPGFGSLPGTLVAVPGFANATVIAGVTFLNASSGVVSTTFEGIPAEILVSNNTSRFPPSNSITPPPGGGGLTANEVRVLLREALGVSQQSRAQIRRPLGSSVRVNVSVVDLDGNVLGLVRTTDAPVFGIDVSLQKARSVAFLSQTGAAAALSAAPDVGQAVGQPGALGTIPFSQYVADTAAFSSGQLTLANGIAIAARTLGNLTRPFFPDGIDGTPNGPLSKPFNQWSIFSTGLQLEVSLVELALVLCPFVPQVQALLGVPNAAACPAPTGGTCTAPTLNAIRNGLQIFGGGVPIYRGGQLIGGIGISGDGVEQDDIVSFLGLHRAGLALGGAIGNAPQAIRSSTVNIGGGQLRYVNCPVSPFLDSAEQTPCDGL